MDWLLYADRSRFEQVPKGRFYVLEGRMKIEDKEVIGWDWHIFLETSDFDVAWDAVPRPGIVVTREELDHDPVLRPYLEDWRAGNDDVRQRFLGSSED